MILAEARIICIPSTKSTLVSEKHKAMGKCELFESLEPSGTCRHLGHGTLRNVCQHPKIIALSLEQIKKG